MFSLHDSSSHDNREEHTWVDQKCRKSTRRSYFPPGIRKPKILIESKQSYDNMYLIRVDAIEALEASTAEILFGKKESFPIFT